MIEQIIVQLAFAGGNTSEGYEANGSAILMNDVQPDSGSEDGVQPESGKEDTDT